MYADYACNSRSVLLATTDHRSGLHIRHGSERRVNSSHAYLKIAACPAVIRLLQGWQIIAEQAPCPEVSRSFIPQSVRWWRSTDRSMWVDISSSDGRLTIVCQMNMYSHLPSTWWTCYKCVEGQKSSDDVTNRVRCLSIEEKKREETTLSHVLFGTQHSIHVWFILAYVCTVL
jgi:hypothetical protein